MFDDANPSLPPAGIQGALGTGNEPGDRHARCLRCARPLRFADIDSSRHFEDDVATWLLKYAGKRLLPCTRAVSEVIRERYVRTGEIPSPAFAKDEYFGRIASFDAAFDSRDFNVHMSLHQIFFDAVKKDAEFARIAEASRPPEFFSEATRGRLPRSRPGSPVPHLKGLLDKASPEFIHTGSSYPTLPHQRGIDKFKMDETAAIVREARRLDIPIACGPSGTAANVFASVSYFVARGWLAFDGVDVERYALAILSKLVLLGAHSIREVMIAIHASFPRYAYAPDGSYAYLDQFTELGRFGFRMYSKSRWDQPLYDWLCRTCYGKPAA